MTGPEHFKAAEDGITASTWQRQNWGEHDSNSDEAAAALEAATWEIRVAQVHATLAVAAAIALSAFDMPAYDSDAWRELAGTSRPKGGEPG
jgi:hypothetical protein